jgi:hypothetical protein
MLKNQVNPGGNQEISPLKAIFGFPPQQPFRRHLRRTPPIPPPITLDTGEEEQ